MNINKELTNKFYESYNPCNCVDCRFFIKNIENKQTNIFKYLKSFNINPLKPYEFNIINLRGLLLILLFFYQNVL